MEAVHRIYLIKIRYFPWEQVNTYNIHIKCFSSFGDLDKDIKKHELVAVETGKNIDDVADALIKAAADDLAGMPEYEHCETAAYAPEPIKDFRKVRRYQYEMTGIVYPPNADKNILIDYGIVEAEE